MANAWAYLQSFFDRWCPVCARPRPTSAPATLAAILCNGCVQGIRTIAPLKVPLTSRSAHVWVHALGAYEGPLELLIQAKAHQRYAQTLSLGRCMAAALAQSPAPYDLIVPVPTHAYRSWWRGYDHTALLAQEISRALHIPWAPVCTRTRSTAMQQTLRRPERRANVDGAFALTSNSVTLARQRILLIDDVCTTGSTIAQVASTLHQAGAVVNCFVGARALID